MTNRDSQLPIAAAEPSGLSRDEDLGQLPAGDQALAIQVRHGPGYVLVVVAGEVDIVTATPLRERLSALAADGGQVVADLDQLSFIDAAGLGALAVAARQAAACGGRLHVVCARRQTRQLFRLTGLDRAVPLARTLAEAVESATAGGGSATAGRMAARRRSRPGCSARQVLPESGDLLPGAAGREVRVEERAPPGRACPDVLAAFLEPMQ